MLGSASFFSKAHRLGRCIVVVEETVNKTVYMRLHRANVDHCRKQSTLAGSKKARTIDGAWQPQQQQTDGPIKHFFNVLSSSPGQSAARLYHLSSRHTPIWIFLFFVLMSTPLKSTPLVAPGHTRPITHLSFSPIQDDGTFLLVSSCKDGNPMLREWTGDWIGTFLGHKGAVWSTKLSLDGSRAASGSADFTAWVIFLFLVPLQLILMVV